ncbi:MAG: TNT domain-containing protein [Clostridiales Family XIII bacterium]|jgi:hypothetical protein|nr:TNT domain-containing protein [Clostridiales Family XIII bacterium]
MSLGPLSNNGGNVPRLAGPGPNTPLLTDGKVTAEQILKTDAPHLNAELVARLATKEGGPDYTKQLDGMSFFSGNRGAGPGVGAGWNEIDISGALPSRANVSLKKPVSPKDADGQARTAANKPPGAAEDAVKKEASADGSGKWTNADGSVKWPINNGFEGAPVAKTLMPGTIVDRYGGETGKFVSPQGTPYANRSLPPSSDARPYNAYEVVKPIDVKSGKISPWFDQPGGGNAVSACPINRKFSSIGIFKEVAIIRVY